MESKKWLWVVIVCLGIVAVHQIVTLTGRDSAVPPSPEVEPALEPERPTMNTASLGELPTMAAERKQPVIEAAKVEEVPQTPAAAESPEPSPEEPTETEELVEVAETTPVSDPPRPVSDQPVVKTTPPATAVAAPVKPSNKGVVRGIVYSGQEGSVLIDDKIVRAGAVIDGVRVVRIHAGGVEFEKDGRRWTQKVSEAPDPLWR